MESSWITRSPPSARARSTALRARARRSCASSNGRPGSITATPTLAVARAPSRDRPWISALSRRRSRVPTRRPGPEGSAQTHAGRHGPGGRNPGTPRGTGHPRPRGSDPSPPGGVRPDPIVVDLQQRSESGKWSAMALPKATARASSKPRSFSSPVSSSMRDHRASSGVGVLQLAPGPEGPPGPR